MSRVHGHGSFLLPVILAAFLQSASAQTDEYSLVYYGNGESNPSQRQPDLEVFGFPIIDHSLYVQVRGGRANSLALLHCSTTPDLDSLFGLPILIGLEEVYSIVPAMTDGAGYASLEVPLANDPSLIGTDFYLQWAVLDGAMMFSEVSNAARVTIEDAIDTLEVSFPITLDINVAGVSSSSPTFTGFLSLSLSAGSSDAEMVAEVEFQATSTAVTFTSGSDAGEFLLRTVAPETIVLTPSSFLEFQLAGISLELGYDELWVGQYVSGEGPHKIFYPITLSGNLTTDFDSATGDRTVSLSTNELMPPDATLFNSASLAFSGLRVRQEGQVVLANSGVCQVLQVYLHIPQSGGNRAQIGGVDLTDAQFASVVATASLEIKRQCCINLVVTNGGLTGVYAAPPSYVDLDTTDSLRDMENERISDGVNIASPNNVGANDSGTPPAVSSFAVDELGTNPGTGETPEGVTVPTVAPERVIIGLESHSDLDAFTQTLLHEIGHALGIGETDPTGHGAIGTVMEPGTDSTDFNLAQCQRITRSPLLRPLSVPLVIHPGIIIFGPLPCAGSPDS